ncbi:MAG: 3TM-type holin [Sulfurifustaceae bacterium]
MGIIDLIAGIFKPAAELVDNLHTSTEEKLTLQKEMQRIQAEFQAKVLEYETRLMEAQASVIRAEAMSTSWLAANWRPITMLSFLSLIILDSMNLLAQHLNDDAWLLLQIGLGGYVAGRSLEKVVGNYKGGKADEAKG